MYDFDALKKIPLASILKMYGIEVFKRGESELICDCPLPSHADSSKDHKRTFAIGVEKNKWYCHSTSCQRAGNHRGGDGIDLVERLDHSTRKDAIKKLASLFAVSEPNTPPSKESETGKCEPTRNMPLAFELKGIEYHPMLRDRKISEATAKEYGVGYFTGKGSMAGRIVFPLFEDAALVGYAGRAVAEDVKPKWLLPKGFIKSFVYGLEKCDPAQPLVLCEGFFAPLFFYERGIQAAALMGKSMSDSQYEQLVPFEIITIAMDFDLAGREAADELVERLSGTHKVKKALLIG